MTGTFRTVTIVLSLLTMFFITGCPKENVTKTMYAAYDSAVTLYNTSYDMLKDMDRLGEIPTDKRPEIKNLMKNAEEYLQTAGTALEGYVAYQKVEDKDKFDSAVNGMNKVIRDIRNILYGEE